jgi:hypothetical protein
MAHSDPDNWNASLQNDFALRSGLLVRRVPFYCFPATIAHERWVLQLLAEVGIVSLLAATGLLAIAIVSIFFQGYFRRL